MATPKDFRERLSVRIDVLIGQLSLIAILIGSAAIALRLLGAI